MEREGGGRGGRKGWGRDGPGEVLERGGRGRRDQGKGRRLREREAVREGGGREKVWERGKWGEAGRIRKGRGESID